LRKIRKGNGFALLFGSRYAIAFHDNKPIFIDSSVSFPGAEKGTILSASPWMTGT